MTFRSRRLLDQAHEMPCCVKFPHECNFHLGCHPMHADSQLFGRGFSHKSPDWAFAAGCGNAHRLLSAQVGGSDMNREQKFTEWLRAYVATQDWLWTNNRLRVA